MNWFIVHNPLSPPPSLVDGEEGRDLGQIGILGGIRHFRWGWFFSGETWKLPVWKTVNANLKQKKKKDFDCNFYNFSLLVTYLNKFLIVCICILIIHGIYSLYPLHSLRIFRLWVSIKTLEKVLLLFGSNSVKLRILFDMSCKSILFGSNSLKVSVLCDTWFWPTIHFKGGEQSKFWLPPPGGGAWKFKKRGWKFSAGAGLLKRMERGGGLALFLFNFFKFYRFCI